MSCGKISELHDAQRSISQHLDELEIKIKTSKLYWRRHEFNFDKKFVLTFVDSHYNEIVNHVAQIKHHLEKISYHKKELDDVKVHFLQQSSTKSDQDEHKTPVQGHIENTIARRSTADKQRVKNLRSARCTSSKYVHQWEKMIDEHKEDSLVTIIKRRSKGGSKSKTETSEKEDVSKRMVTSRVLQFEDSQKSKRTSSTIEAFLDYCIDKPSRGVSCPIIDEIGLPTCERPQSKEIETASGDNSRYSLIPDSPILPKNEFKDTQNKVFGDKHSETEELLKQRTQPKKPSRDRSEPNATNGGNLQKPQKDKFGNYVNTCSTNNTGLQYADEHNRTENIKKETRSKLLKTKNRGGDAHSKKKSSKDNLNSVNENNFCDLLKDQEDQFTSCIDMTKQNEDLKLKDADKPINFDSKEEPQEFKNMIDHLHDVQSKVKPLDNQLNEAEGTCSIKKETRQKTFENKREELSRMADANEPVTDPMKTPPVKHAQEELSKNNSIKDIIEDKSHNNGSRFSLLDDVNALLEDDHLKIIRKEKAKLIQGGIGHEQKKEINVILPVKQIPNLGSCEDLDLPEDSPTKPRIVEMHYKKDLPPDVLFQTVPTP